MPSVGCRKREASRVACDVRNDGGVAPTIRAEQERQPRSCAARSCLTNSRPERAGLGRRRAERGLMFAAGGDLWPTKKNPPCSWSESRLSRSSADTQKSSPPSLENGDAPPFLTYCSSPLSKPRR